MISAKVIEDSRAPNGVRLTTLQLRFPRFLLPEFNTHRVFSRNASSSRAIPVAKVIDQVRCDPAMPLHWGRNQPGMQASAELQGRERELAIAHWKNAAQCAADVAEQMAKLGLHKQVANRILEPFQFAHVVVSSTEWKNFFELRDHPDAQPEIRALAYEMRRAILMSAPDLRPCDRLHADAWHLPYVTADERGSFADQPELLAKLSAARCARVSYVLHDGRTPDMDEDLKLFERLVGSRPLHASPVEHQAYPLPHFAQQSKNFQGWRQHREIIEAKVAA